MVAANDRGLKLDGEADWRNVSKFADGVTIPSKGARVLLGLDKAGFVRTVTAQDAPERPVVGETASEATPAPVDRDTRIMRQAVLNTSVAILSAGGRSVEVDAVLVLAAELERWVLR